MKTYPSRARRGSAVITVVLITTCLSIVLFSLLSLGLTERRLNSREVLASQARYAAESVVENAIAQAVRQLKANSWVASDRFNTKKNPSALSKPSTSAFAGTFVDTGSLELKVGNLTTFSVVNIPIDNPDVLFGPVPTRRVVFYGKATATDGLGNAVTAYCSEALHIRGQSPACGLGFYNMDLELAPGPEMTAAGPIFSNRNIYLAASNKLVVKGTVTTHQNLVWGRIVEDSLSAWNKDSAAQKGLVQLASAYASAANPDDEGTYSLADFYRSGTYADSVKSSSDATWTDAKWKNKESSQFKGMVQTSVDDIEERKFAGITDLADAHVVIDPPVADGASGYDQNVELQKFSNKAGIIIRPPRIATTTAKKKSTNYTKTVVNGGSPTVSAGASTTTTSSSDSSDSATVWAYVPEGSQTGTYTGPYTRTNEDGTLGKYYLMDITSSISNLDKILTVTKGTSTTASATSDAGFYDGREGEWMTVYNIDVSELKTAVASASAGDALHDQWNGIIYIDSRGYDTSETSATTQENLTSKTTTSKKGVVTETTTWTEVASTTTQSSGSTAVMLKNGGLGNLPLSPTATQNEAFTVATNDPVYIRGNYNADGSFDAAIPESIRKTDANEVMACVAADAVTILSNNWGNNEKSSGTKASRVASKTEVSAVLLTGLVSTSVGSSYSGGMHNFPRFLESWSNVPFGYRGSLLAFFESKRAKGKWTLSYYDPPNRIWGWNKKLENGYDVAGLGKTPLFKRAGFSDLSPSEYSSATSGL
ncbi:MAG TPA: hypothetical protein VK181_23310 [Rhizobium sp.]|nr:hypothetical protein [Rhizobium sp.]